MRACCELWRHVSSRNLVQGELHRVLELFCALSAVTAGVEQSFSKAQWAMAGGRRSHQTEDLEAEEMKLLADKIPES